MGSWSRYRRAGGGGGGLFLRVESGGRDFGPGVEFLVPPTAVPHESYVRWTDDGAVDEDGPGDGVSRRVLIHVVRPTGEPGILDLPPGAWDELAEALDHPKVGGTDQIYEVAKKGSALQTRWRVRRLDRATPDQIAWAARAALPEITRGRPMQPAEAPTKPEITRGSVEPAEPPPDDIPF